MRITPVRPAMRSFDKDERSDRDHKRFQLFLELIDGMDLPSGRVEMLRDPATSPQSLNWLNRNLAVRNSGHKDFRRVRNLLTLILKSEYPQRDRR